MGSGAIQYERKRIVGNWGIDQKRPPAPYIFDDFLGDTLNTDLWVASSPQATGGTDFAISTTAGDPVAGHGGWIAGTKGTGDDDEEIINGEILWTPSRAVGGRMLVFETRLSAPVVTTIRLSAGFTDVKNEGPFDLGASDAITSTATDAAAWIVDTDADTDEWFGLNVDTNADGDLVSGAGAPTAATATVLRIEIDALGQCFYYFDDSESDQALPALIGSDTTGVTETVALTPFVDVLTRGDVDNQVVEVDYLFISCAR